ncbi:ABC transporter ATP-binding protein [Pseudomonas amygdali]|uniref:ABC transporter ATP-binding protein n=1 Tax=Pseudomonas amygdali TaxID=47877 RepID=UPI001CD8D537|nr:ABC transporter ATP-binding protein [Pseudomonas amygdali]UBT80467.1 ABC transporter ATP-binding protein [Pseudomonas amygdali]
MRLRTASSGIQPETPDDDIFVELSQVSFGYGDSDILSDVSMRFLRGKVTAILGGSGCGKTTLLRLIAGVHAPRGGHLCIDGRRFDANDRAQLYALRRRLGMLLQFGALFTDLTVYENVAFALREHTDLGEDAIRDIVLMKLNAVGLRGAADMRIDQVSGGMARRIALARSIVLDPELVMYDEPFSGLDPISMGVIASLIRNLNTATGATTLMVTHDVRESFAICDYAYLMGAGGRVIAAGTPAELQASTDPEVRQFIRGEPDGPVRFHYPAMPIGEQLGVKR